MKLSICMMVKNEERYLRQCLKSIQPLVKELETELIIVDTGSTDTTVEIAKDYTDKIFFHEWNNDFSGMRNLTISHAKAQWIFILDGDEIVEDCKNIIIFLQSKLATEYNVAMVDVKNYVDIEKDNYGLLSSARFFKNGNISYEGLVHNQPVYEGPVIKLNDVVLLHYGYIANDKELMERKFQRTSNLLIKQLEKDPESIYYRYQLSVSYLMHRDMEEGLIEGEKLYQRLSKDRALAAKYLYVYGHMAKLYGLKARYEEVKRVAEEGLEINAEYVDLWFYLHHSSIVLEQYSEGIKAGLKYISLVENYASLAISKESAIIMDNLNKISTVNFGLAYSHMKLDNYEEALKYLAILEADFEISVDFDAQVTKACFSTGQFLDLKLYGERHVYTKGSERIQLHMANMEENRRKIAQNDHDKYLAFLDIFSQIAGSYGSLNDIRLAFEKRNGELFLKLDGLVATLNLNSVADYTADIFYIMLDCDYPIADVLTCIREENINIYLGYLNKNYPDFIIRVKQYLAKKQDNDTYSLIRTNKIFAEFVLENDSSLSKEEYENYFLQYLRNGFDFIKMLYNPVIMENELIDDMKNPEEIALLYLMKAEDYKESDPGLAIKNLEKAKDAFPALERGIALIIENIEHPELSMQKEMEKYKIKVKDSIHNYISNRQFEVADGLIDEYLNIVAGDLDILGCKASILMEKEEWSQAKKVLIRIVEKDPENADMLLNLAVCENRIGDHDAAVRSASLAKMLRRDETINLDFLNPHEIYNPCVPKVLHGTMEIANQMHTLTYGLRDSGLDAKSLCYYPNYLGYKTDYILDIGKFTSVEQASLETKKIASQLILNYDIFHFHFGTSLALDHSDLPVINELGKKIIMHHWGSDVRLYSKAIELNPFIKVKTMDEKSICKNLEYLGRYIDHCIVADDELYQYVKDYYKNVHIIRQALDLTNYSTIQIKKKKNKKLLIVHAPSSPEFKGTQYIVRAIENLKPKYDFEFRLIQGMPHEEAKKIYAQADIIIDQVLIGSYGLFAIESMALGKPVICWISDFMRDKYPDDLPIISANPDSIEKKLEHLINDREELDKIDADGRLYVEKYHDIKAISEQLVDLYKNL